MGPTQPGCWGGRQTPGRPPTEQCHCPCPTDLCMGKRSPEGFGAAPAKAAAAHTKSSVAEPGTRVACWWPALLLEHGRGRPTPTPTPMPTHTHTLTLTLTEAQVYTHTCMPHAHASTHAHTHMYAHTDTRMYAHPRVLTCRCAYTFYTYFSSCSMTCTETPFPTDIRFKLFRPYKKFSLPKQTDLNLALACPGPGHLTHPVSPREQAGRSAVQCGWGTAGTSVPLLPAARSAPAWHDRAPHAYPGFAALLIAAFCGPSKGRVSPCREGACPV